MRLERQLLTHNDCYKEGRIINPKGVMIHSTGVDQPWVRRYLPGNDTLGYNINGNHWDRPGLNKCVHAFIGKFSDGNVGTVQTLPWNWRGWHAGGAANNTHISFEICEDDLTDPDYFQAVYRQAVELTADLCREYGLSPKKEGVVICHREGYLRGVASNHADVLHWFPKHGKSMDDFRADVDLAMEKGEDMTQEQFDQMMDRYLARRAAQVSTMPQLIQEARTMGLTDGSRPRDFLTREEGMVMARAAAKWKT